jgi:uncharacterized membrane protein (UPF0127 family)
MTLLRTFLCLFLFTLFSLLPGIALAQEPARIEQVTVVSTREAATFEAEVADTDDLRARGLMFRHKLPEDRAMLFDFGDPRPAAMWMKNTYISLDMLFIRADGSIAAVAENTEPLSLADDQRPGASESRSGGGSRDCKAAGHPARRQGVPPDLQGRGCRRRKRLRPRRRFAAALHL